MVLNKAVSTALVPLAFAGKLLAGTAAETNRWVDSSPGLFSDTLSSVCGVGQDLALGCAGIRSREAVDATASPWRAIGRVNFASIETRQHCTGTLVAENIVLTAAHCLFNAKRNAWIPANSIVFAAGYQRGEATASSPIATYVVDNALNTESRKFNASAATDWALLVLKQPIGRETGFLTLKFDQQEPTRNAEVFLAGYAGIRPHVLSLASDCGVPIYQQDSQTIQGTCSVMRGDSGAPLLTVSDGAYKVAGVTVSVIAKPNANISVSIPVETISEPLKKLLKGHQR